MQPQYHHDAPVKERKQRKPRRPRAPIDRRTRTARRIRELSAIFSDALGGDLSPMMRERVRTAAHRQAVAELAREQFLAGRGDAPSLDDVVRAERAADTALRALRLGDRPQQPTAPTVWDYARQLNEAPSR